MRKVYVLLSLILSFVSTEIYAQCTTAVATWSQNFDAVTAPALPNCFVKKGNGGVSVRTLATTVAPSQPNALFMQSSGALGRGVVSLPLVSNFNAGTHQLRFKARKASAAANTTNPHIELGYYTNPSQAPLDTLTYVPLQSFYVTSTAWAEYTFRPGTLPTTGLFAIRASQANNAIVIDDMFWEPIPAGSAQCTPQNVRYELNFDNVTAPALPECTSVQTSTGNSWGVTPAINSLGFNAPGNHLIYSYNSDEAANSWFITKGLNLTAGTNYFISYKYGNDNTTQYVENLKVAYGSQPLGGSMTNVLADHTGITTSPNVNTVNFTVPTNGVYYFGFQAYSDADQNVLLLDSIVVDAVQACGTPVGNGYTAITTNGATLNIIAPTPAPSGGYQYYYSTTNLAPANTTAGTAFTGATASITGLTPGTTYYVWVRSVCSAGVYTSWVSATSFTTLCTAVSVPYTENFDGATTPGIPTCTTQQTIGTSNAWVTTAAPATPTWGMGPGGNILVYPYSTTNAANTWWYTRGLNLTGGTTYYLKYKYAARSATYAESMEVKYGNVPIATSMTNMLRNLPSITDTLGVMDSVSFVPATTGVYFIGFHANSAADKWMLLLDSVHVNSVQAQTCAPVTTLAAANVTTNSATISFTAPSPAPTNGYTYYISTTATQPTVGHDTLWAPPIMLTQLLPNTTYYVWVRANCSSTSQSTVAGPVSFTTGVQCDTVTNIHTTAVGQNSATIAFTAPASAPANGYTYYISNTSTMPSTGTQISASPISVTGLQPGMTYYVWIVSNCAANVTRVSSMYSFMTQSAACGDPMNLTLGAVTQNSISVSFTPPASAPTGYTYYYNTTNTVPATGTAFTGTSFTISGLTAGTQYYIWVVANCGATNSGAAGPVVATTTAAPVCNAPTGLTVGTVTQNTLSLSFTAPTGAPSGYTYYYSTTNTMPATGTAFTGTSFTISGLTAGTQYYVWVVSNCGTLNSTPAGPVTATTTAAPVCNAPTALTVGTVTENTISVSFTAPAGAPAGYTYYYSTTNTMPATGTAFTGTSFTISGLTAGTQYYVWVVSNCGTLSSTPAGPVTATTTAAAVCNASTGVAVANITQTGADVTFTAASPAPATGYEYVVTTASTPDQTPVPFTGTSVSLANLTSGTAYNVFIRSNCGNGLFSAWTAATAFTTTSSGTCVAVNVPYLENFEDITTPEIPTCTAIETISGSDWVTSASPAMLGFTAADGNVLMYSYDANNAANSWFITKGVNLTAGTNYFISYKYGARSATYPEKLKVAMGTGANSAALTTVLADHGNVVPPAQTNVVNFTVPTTGVYYFGFNAYSNADQWNLYVDSIFVDALASCLPPTAVAASAITGNSANITFTAPTSAPANGYEYVVSTTNTPPATAGTASTGSPIALSGLGYSTTYYVFVRSICSTTDASVWTSAVSFTTLPNCIPVNVPYLEDFSDVTPPALPTCTSIETLSGNNWVTAVSPNVNGFDAAGGNIIKYVYNTTQAANSWFYTKGVNLTAGANYFISYKYGVQSGSYPENLKVAMGAAASNTAMTTTLADHPNINTNPAQTNVVNFTVPTTGVYYFGFNAYSDADMWNLFVDSIFVNLVPTCIKPTAVTVSGITGSGATVAFTPPATAPANGYEYVVSTTNTVPTGAGTATTGTPITLSGLNFTTTYYVFVRAICSATDASDWTGAVSFTTLANCAPVNVRYEEHFESVTVPNIPECTLAENLGTGNNWTTAVSPASGDFTTAGGNVLKYGWNFSNDADAWWMTKGINLTAGTNYFISYKYGTNSSTTYTENLGVAYGTSQAGSAMTNSLADHNGIQTGYAGLVNTVTFTVPTTGVYYFGFHAYSAANQFNLYLDSIVVDVVPTCMNVTNISTTNITSTTATVTFSPSASTTVAGYEFVVSTTNVTPTGAGTAITGSPINLTGLAPSTTYYVFVKTICSATDQSIWMNGGSFTTQCAPISTFPWTENFDALPSVGINIFPNCWYKENGDWRTANTGTDTYTDPLSPDNYLRNTWSATDEFIWTPGFQVTAGTSYDFSFWFRGDGYTGWQGDVFMNSAQNSAGATALGGTFITLTETSSTTYQKVTRTFVPTTSGVVYFAIRQNANSTPWYIGYDDFFFAPTPSCPSPSDVVVTSIGNNSVTVDWNGPSNGQNWEYYVSTTNTAPTASTTPTGTSDSTGALITGLTSNTQYFIWIRANCGGGDISYWTSPLSVTTACDPVTALPWSENFDGLTTVGANSFPGCWKKENGDWATGTSALTTYHDPMSAPNYLTERYSATNEFIWTPGFMFEKDSSYDFSFWFIGDGAKNWTGDIFVNQLQNSAGAQPLGAFISPDTNSVNQYKQIFKRFTPTASGIYYFALRVNAPFMPNYLGFDDFKVAPSPQCFVPGTGVVYDQAYCVQGTNGTPTINGTQGGSFTSSPGLTVDPATGSFNPSTTPLGTYAVSYVLAAHESCPVITFSDTLHVVAAPTANISYATTTFCNNAASITPTLTGQVNGTFSSTTGLAINPANGTIDAANSAGGNYTVTYTIPETNGCAAFTTTAAITVNAVSVAPTSVEASASSVCGNGTVSLSIIGGTLGSGAQWTWYKDDCNGTSIGTGATLSNVTVNANTTFYVKASGACNTTECVPVTITHGDAANVSITAAPSQVATPLSPVTLTAHVTDATGPYFIRWYKNGTLLANQNDTSLVVLSTEVGAYKAEAVSGTCNSLSNELAITAGTDPNEMVFISPNPGRGVFFIRMLNTANARSVKSVMVFDSKGARVFYKRYVSTSSIFNMEINITSAASGVYFVKMLDANDREIASGKYLKQ